MLASGPQHHLESSINAVFEGKHRATSLAWPRPQLMQRVFCHLGEDRKHLYGKGASCVSIGTCPKAKLTLKTYRIAIW